MNGYELTSNFYNYKFDSNGRVKHTHADLYFYIIDLWNRLGQKPEFGLPTTVAMSAVGMGSYNTYKATLNDLIEFGFIKLVKDSNNQHSAKIVALSFYDEPTDKPSIKPLDKATIKASNEPTDKPTDTIIEQEIINYKQEIKRLKEESEFSKNENYALSKKVIDFEKMIEEKDLEIQSLKDQEKKGKEKSSAKKESLVYEFPEDFSEEVILKFMGFVENRKDIGKAVKTQRTVNELIEAITPFDNTDRLMAIRHSIGNGWTGIFPKKTNNSNLVYHNHDKNGTTSQISNSRHKSNWNAEEVARDAIAIATAHLR